jgi:(E)-4-hydroxy-3-methylbut-2-enyl-diphosphate synthase
MRNRRVVYIGNVPVGGNNPITIQSMTNTETKNIEATVDQIKSLEKAGCEIVRVAVPDMESAEAIRKIKKKINIPLIADIHFDYRLALKSIDQGIDGLRINPGNIKKEKYVEQIVQKIKKSGRSIPIRIGVNSGSINRKKYNVTPSGLVDSAVDHIKILEKLNFYDIKVSLKSSDVLKTIKSYEKFSKKMDYPLHGGITEAGGSLKGTVKSSTGLGILLYKKLCDTIRVSLTGDPVKEVEVAKNILSSLNKRKFGVEIISCPTCGRAKIDVESMVKKVENNLPDMDKNLKIAIMGCAVNGPGEARDADIGIAGGTHEGLIFLKDKIIGKYKEDNLIDELIKNIEKYYGK